MDKNEFASKVLSQKIVIIGDLLVDEYIYSHTSNKIAREAPVVVTKYDRTEKRIGGAGNAVRNAMAWGGTVVPVGFVGDDENGRFILDELKKSGIRTSNIITVENRNTPTKTRFMSGVKRGTYQQVFRMDRQNDEPYSFEYQSMLVSSLKETLNFVKPDIIIISDYGLSTLTGQMSYEIVSGAKIVLNYPVFIDSHSPGKFKGAQGIVVNMEEAIEALNAKEPTSSWEVKEMCRDLINKFDSKYVLLTRGKSGVVLFEREIGDEVNNIISIPIDDRFSPTDITGVGDTVVVAFSRSLVASGNPELATRIANIAAGISISQPGAAVADIQKTIDSVVDLKLSGVF